MLLHKLNFQALVKLAVSLILCDFFVDIDDCVSHTCTNGASCVDGINTYSCNCAAGFSGAYCETGRFDIEVRALLSLMPICLYPNAITDRSFLTF